MNLPFTFPTYCPFCLVTSLTTKEKLLRHQEKFHLYLAQCGKYYPWYYAKDYLCYSKRMSKKKRFYIRLSNIFLPVKDETEFWLTVYFLITNNPSWRGKAWLEKKLLKA